MDLFTFLGWTLLVWLAYKVGMYVERKMKAKAQAATDEKGSDRNP